MNIIIDSRHFDLYILLTRNEKSIGAEKIFGYFLVLCFFHFGFFVFATDSYAVAFFLLARVFDLVLLGFSQRYR